MNAVVLGLWRARAATSGQVRASQASQAPAATARPSRAKRHRRGFRAVAGSGSRVAGRPVGEISWAIIGNRKHSRGRSLGEALFRQSPAGIARKPSTGGLDGCTVKRVVQSRQIGGPHGPGLPEGQAVPSRPGGARGDGPPPWGTPFRGVRQDPGDRPRRLHVRQPGVARLRLAHGAADRRPGAGHPRRRPGRLRDPQGGEGAPGGGRVPPPPPLGPRPPLLADRPRPGGAGGPRHRRGALSVRWTATKSAPPPLPNLCNRWPEAVGRPLQASSGHRYPRPSRGLPHLFIRTQRSWRGAAHLWIGLPHPAPESRSPDLNLPISGLGCPTFPQNPPTSGVESPTSGVGSPIFPQNPPFPAWSCPVLKWEPPISGQNPPRPACSSPFLPCSSPFWPPDGG